MLGFAFRVLTLTALEEGLKQGAGDWMLETLLEASLLGKV